MTEEEIAKHVTDKWSPIQVRALVKYWGTMRSQELADIVGKTHMACIGKAHRMRLPPVDVALRNRWRASGRTTHRGPDRYTGTIR